jgi:hypothetical protein
LTLGVACPAVAADPPVPAQAANAPRNITIAGRVFRLETYLWRDFMPMNPPSGSKMLASIKLVSADGKPIPSGVSLDTAWIEKSASEVWHVTFTNESRPSYPNAIERMGRQGPTWGPGIDVDVVVRVVTPSGTVLVRAPKQRIQRTD